MAPVVPLLTNKYGQSLFISSPLSDVHFVPKSARSNDQMAAAERGPITETKRMSFQIRRVAVLGAGVMGAGIAAHLANAGVESLLFDIVPPDASDSPADRNRFALRGIETARKIKPAAFYRKDFASRITPCNYEDHADLLKTCDLVIEVVVERLDIKAKVYEWVAANRAPGSIVSSNTSGIRLADMAASMSEDMRKHFLITHFFNPVRYMRLLELVTGPDTLPEVTAAVAKFGEEVLGKGIVYGKDTANFVANRIGTFGMASVFRYMLANDLTVEEVDAIFGPAMGRPKSAVFRTADIVGIDTLAHVFGNVVQNAPDDEQVSAFEVPEFVKTMIAKGATGQKAGAGFYKKAKVDGKKTILVLDLKTGEYREKEKVRYPSLGAARKADKLSKKLEAVVYGEDKAALAAWTVLAETLIYSANRIPEIADDIVNVDRAMRWGFAWDMGPFETWDAIGVQRSVERMEAEGLSVPAWVKDMLASGRESFYARDGEGFVTYFGLDGQIHRVPVSANHLFVADIKARRQPVDRNVSASIHDMGDGVGLLEFHSKMNALDDGIFEMYEKALDHLDAGRFDALVVGNEGAKAFCAGANLLMILMGAMQQEWDSIDNNIARLQSLLLRAQYHAKPIVTAPHQLVLGGGAEVAMQSAATVASGETYMGLVEVGVGLIPGGGGCKEMAMRFLGDQPHGVKFDPNPFVQKAFEIIGTAKVATSAEEARSFGFLRPNDRVVIDPDARLATAKKLARGMADGGYKPRAQRRAMAAGRTGYAAIEAYLYQMHEGRYISEHDMTVGLKLANVLVGGDVPQGTMLSEQAFLDLEREAFLSLCGEPKTIERIQHMLQTGKPLRN